MKPLSVVILICVVTASGVVFSAPPGAAADSAVQQEENVSFHWAFGAQVGTKTDRKLVAITRDTVLKTGDRLQMLVELQEPCFVYVVLHSAEGEAHLLFPSSAAQSATDFSTPKRHYIPNREEWFELDEHVGRETFYLLASAQRLAGLEALFAEYEAADASKRPDLVEGILAHIREVKRRHRSFARRAQRPISIAGNLRGMPSDIAQFVVKISATTFYSKTFTIDHRE